MSDRPKPTRGAYVVLAFPLLMLLIFFVAPFGIMIAYSFYRRISGGFYDPAFDLGSWKRLFEPVFLDRAVFSIGISLLAGAVCIAVRVPVHVLPHPHASSPARRPADPGALGAQPLGGHRGVRVERRCWDGPRASRTSSSGSG